MKRLSFVFIILAGVILFASCNDTETYAEQKERERNAINAFIVKKGINVISEEEFVKKDSTTDVSRNEFVLFENTGVYMQIVRKGCGKKMESGETATVLCRFNEYNLLTDSLMATNNNLYYSAIVDKMQVVNNSGTFTASFDTGSSALCLYYSAYYGSTKLAVPSGWLVPFRYINL